MPRASFLLCLRTRDIRAAKRTGKLGMMLSWESGCALQNDLELLHAAYRLGLRSSTITHNEGATGTPRDARGEQTYASAKACLAHFHDSVDRMGI